jgi:AbrB family looped-hinge helix DNA binding protein
METTKLSTKGQLILPKPIRDKHRWEPGTEFIVEETPQGILLRRARPFPATRLEDVSGCLKYHGKAKTIQEMDRGIAEAIKKRHARGR